MKVPDKIKTTRIILLICICANNIYGQTSFKISKKRPAPIVVSSSVENYENPYESSKLDYHDFKMQGQNPWSTTQGDWYLKYKKMFDFRCKEPFWGASPKYKKKDYMKSGYQFRLVNNQAIEDSLQFLLDKYSLNSLDTLKAWNLPPNKDNKRTEKIIKRLGLRHFKIIETVFNSKKHSQFIEVPEADQANDNMVYMEIMKYPADVDVFLYNFKIDNWEYVESVTVSGDHELELYVLQKFEPRYLKNCTETILTSKKEEICLPKSNK